MKHYIGNTHQKKGDRCYNRKEYDNALQHYINGFKDLNAQKTKNPALGTSKQFQDNYTYALTDIIITQSKIIDYFIADSAAIDSTAIVDALLSYQGTVTNIVSRIALMEKSWEAIKNKPLITTKQRLINEVHGLFSSSFELFSDLCSATADEIATTLLQIIIITMKPPRSMK